MNRKDIGQKIGQGLLLFVIFLCFGKLFFMAGKQVFSNESEELLKQGFMESMETWTDYVMQEIIPIKTMLEREKLDYGQWLTALLSSELLPIFHFESGYDAVETLAIDNQDYLYLMEENEDENQREMQEKERLEKQTEEKEKIQKDKETAQGKGKVYTKKQLYNTDFLMKNFYVVESTAKLKPSEINGQRLLNRDLSIQLEGKKPKILIYHTHASETFKDSHIGRKEESVVGIGDYLTELLETKYHIPVYHDRSVYDMIHGKLDRSKAYNQSLQGIEQILKENPSIEVVIDLHRDGVSEKTHLATKINGKSTAQLMFMNGVSCSSKNGDISYLYNPNKEDNLAFTLQMQLEAEKKYPDLMRKIYIKTYRYNLHVKPRAVLIEAGANTNTVQEVKNAMLPLSDILNAILK